MGRRRNSGDGFSDGLPDGDAPVDIAAVRRDDALIDAISGHGPVETESTEEYELATLLADWRAEILSEPMPAGPDLDQVVAAVNRELGARDALAGRRARSKSQLRLIRPLVGAAALVALAVGGAGAVSYSAEPGDALWGVKQVVFSEQAQSTEARIDTTSTLEQAEQLIADGYTQEAQELLQSAEVRSTGVKDSSDRDALGEWLQRLSDEINKLVLPPIVPLPQPQVPLPPVGTGDLAQDPSMPVTPVEPAPLPSPLPTQSPSPMPTQSPVPSPTTVDPTILDAPLPPPSDPKTTTPSPVETSTPQPPSSTVPASDATPQTQLPTTTASASNSQARTSEPTETGGA